MSECFCGCHEPIGHLQRARHQANETGAKVTTKLADLNQYVRPWIEAGRPGFEELDKLPETPDATQEFTEQLAEGTLLRESCLAIVHQVPGGEPPGKSAAKEWLNSTDMIVAIARMPLDNRRRIAAAIATGTPQEIRSSFEAGERQATS